MNSNTFDNRILIFSQRDNVRSFTLEDRTAAVHEFKRYYPILDDYWGVFGEHKEVMKSATGCLKLALAYPFLSTFRLLLLAIGYGLNADTMKSFMMTDGSRSFMMTDGSDPASQVANEYYQRIFEFNDLARTVSQHPEEANIYQVIESTEVTLKDLLKTFITGANQISTLTVNEMGSSLKSCLDMFVKIKDNKKLQQDFIDAVTGKRSSNLVAHYDWRDSEPTGETREMIRKLEAARRNPAGGSSSRGQSSVGSFFGWGKKEDDPFAGCTKVSLRDSDDDNDGGHDDDEYDHGHDDSNRPGESYFDSINPFRGM